MCLITIRIQRVVSSKTVKCSSPVDYTYFNDNGKDSLLLRHAIHKNFRMGFDHEDKHHATFLKTIWLPHILVLE